MRYKNYEILQDKFSWQVNVYWTVKEITSDNYWKETVTYSCYPSTLENCFLKVRTYMIKELMDTVEIDSLIEWIRTLDKEFKEFISLHK